MQIHWMCTAVSLSSSSIQSFFKAKLSCDTPAGVVVRSERESEREKRARARESERERGGTVSPVKKR